MKVTRAWYELRKQLYDCKDATDAMITSLRECDHPDAVFFLRILKPGMTWLRVYEALRRDRDPLSRLYYDWFRGKVETPRMDHSLSDLIYARTLDDYKQVALKWNEPDAWYVIGEFGRAADMGHIFAMGSYAYQTNDGAKAYALFSELFNTHNVCDIYFSKQDTPSYRFYIGKFCSEHSSSQFGNYCSDIDYYNQQVSIARDATVTWLMCARRLRVCRDVARLIGTLIWASRIDTKYEPLRRSKRLKLKK